MKILVLAPSYPHTGYSVSGVFNEKSTVALQELGHEVEVLAPRPYVPPLFSHLMPRWKTYACIKGYEVRNRVPVYRPACPVVPRIGGALWVDQAAFLWCRRIARNMNRRICFDAILSFDLVGAGGIAWRIGRDLGIPASGWATGSDVRVPASSSHGRAVIRALERLDLVFYQSHELLEKAASLRSISSSKMSVDRHVILPRGIQMPPSLCRMKYRKKVRKELGVTDDQVLILYVGRIFRGKGIFDLVNAVSLAATRDSRITSILVGSSPAYDETAAVQKRLNEIPGSSKKVRLLPHCNADEVWEYLCAADIFAFASHHEGMPNSLLEAMAMGVPAIAFAIPPVVEIEAGTGALLTVKPLDSALFAQAILRLAASAEERDRVGEKGKSRVMDRFMVHKNMSAALRRLTQIVERRTLSKGHALTYERI